MLKHSILLIIILSIVYAVKVAIGENRACRQYIEL